jgi:hypothetical protein
VVAIALGVLVLGETITAMVLAGVALVLAGVGTDTPPYETSYRRALGRIALSVPNRRVTLDVDYLTSGRT